MRSLGIAACVCASACFVDAVGGDTANGGGAQNGAAPAGSTGAGAPPASSSVTAATGTGGASSATSGATSTSGQGGDCDGVLAFAGDQIAVLDHDEVFDLPDDFSFGLRVRPAEDPKFSPGNGDAASALLSRASVSQGKGYLLALSELNDDGEMHARAGVIFSTSSTCIVTDPGVIAADSWATIVGHYLRDDSNGASDLFLFVDGTPVGETDCGAMDVPTFTQDVTVGATFETSGTELAGLIDDVVLKGAGPPPLIPEPAVCGNGVLAAFPFDGSLASLCAAPLAFTLGGSPYDPPAQGCAP